MKKSPTMTFWKALDTFPPYFVRMLAKEGPYVASSDAEIAIRSGLAIDRVREIKMMTDWSAMTVGEMRAYFAGCRFDPTRRPDRARIWLYEYTCRKRQTRPFQYLENHPRWESEILPVVKLAHQITTRSAA